MTSFMEFMYRPLFTAKHVHFNVETTQLRKQFIDIMEVISAIISVMISMMITAIESSDEAILTTFVTNRTKFFHHSRQTVLVEYSFSIPVDGAFLRFHSLYQLE